MEPSICKQLIIGLPGTGKSTFIAALWHTVKNAKIKDTLKLDELHGDSTHLNALTKRWLKCSPVERTKQVAEAVVSLRLCNPADEKLLELHLPDFSGESFNSQWKDRKWAAGYDELVNQASGSLLFVHPHKIDEAETIGRVTKWIKKFGDQIDSSENEAPNESDLMKDDELQESKGERDTKWNINDAPTQVKLVELLQFLELRLNVSKFRLAVIISAWDLVAKQKIKMPPGKWFQQRLPMLAQYLKANSEQFHSKVYGISAQGADYGNEELKSSLCELFDQTERIKVVDGDGDKESHDITKPIKWIMSQGD